MSDYKLVSTEPTEWACDTTRGYFGYSVHINDIGWPDEIGFPAFTHEQMLECQRIEETLATKHNLAVRDEVAELRYDAERNIWLEIWWDETVELEPFTVDGVELFALGRWTGWVWGEVCDNYEYETV